MPLSPARKTAFDILRKVAGGGYASDLLRERSHDLRSLDAGLASELVYGVLRFRSQLDFLITRFSDRDPQRLDREVRIALRMGIYQLRYLDRIPRHAAINESVELVKRAHKRSASGLVNAVLRRVNRQPVSWPDRTIALSHPAWLLESWEDQFGAETAAGIAHEFLKPPRSYVRVAEGRETQTTGIDLVRTEMPGCYRLLSGDAPGFRQQDIGSQAVVPLLDLEPGQRFLDLCAAPGNKTAQAMETAVETVASDISLRRLEAIALPEASLVNLDGTHPLPFKPVFDRILVDAPCSGTGTIRRNPEIKWRVQPKDLAGHHNRQVRLLKQALGVLAPGGRVIYSTCSLEKEENESVIEAVLAESAAGIRVERMTHRIPGADPGDGFFAAVLVREAG